MAHSPVNFPARANDPARPSCQDTLGSYHATSAGSSKMPLRGDYTINSMITHQFNDNDIVIVRNQLSPEIAVRLEDD